MLDGGRRIDSGLAPRQTAVKRLSNGTVKYLANPRAVRDPRNPSSQSYLHLVLTEYMDMEPFLLSVYVYRGAGM